MNHIFDTLNLKKFNDKIEYFQEVFLAIFFHKLAKYYILAHDPKAHDNEGWFHGAC